MTEAGTCSLGATLQPHSGKRDRYAPAHAQDIVDLIRHYPLASIVSQRADGRFLSSMLPLLPVQAEDGSLTGFLGHFARSNPQVEQASSLPLAHVTFQGPHGYIRPNWLSQTDWGPTWNYAVASFNVEIRLQPERNEEAIEALVAAMEGTHPGAWTVAALGERYRQLTPHVVAFEATITEACARFKLGQDESERGFEEIVSALGDSPLARLMVQQKPA